VHFTQLKKLSKCLPDIVLYQVTHLPEFLRRQVSGVRDAPVLAPLCVNHRQSSPGQSHKKCGTGNSSGEERKEPEQAATTNIIYNDKCNQRCKKAQQSGG